MTAEVSWLTARGPTKLDVIAVGTRKLTLREAAETASEMLREVVKKFLPQGSKPDFCAQNYWERRLFGC